MVRSLSREMTRRRVRPAGRAVIRARLNGDTFETIARRKGCTRQAVHTMERLALRRLGATASIAEIMTRDADERRERYRACEPVQLSPIGSVPPDLADAFQTAVLRELERARQLGRSAEEHLSLVLPDWESLARLGERGQCRG